MLNQTQCHDDLRYVFRSFPLTCLYHLWANSHRLIRGAYIDQHGNGCIMYLLSESLPVSRRIFSKQSLLAHFSHDNNDEAPEYQPAKWIVRLWDASDSPQIQARYGPNAKLEAEEVLNVLVEMIEEREGTEVQPLNAVEDSTRQMIAAGV